MLYLEILFVVTLVVVNGLLAMSELALVSSRRSRLDHLARQGSRGARTALRLIDDPSGFLSTIQIGITLVGILAGAFGGATLADRLGDWLDSFPALAPNGDSIAIGLVVVAITYLSLIVGELVPKRIALANPERVASIVARAMHRLSRLATPGVWVLRSSTEAVLRLLGLAGTRSETVTEDEVKSLIAEGTQAGVFAPQERRMIEGVLRLADRPVRVVMTPRAEVVWIDSRADVQTLRQIVENNRFTRLLVCENSIDNAIGLLHMKDVLPLALRGEPVSVQALMVPVLVVPDRTSVLQLLDRFRREGLHMAVVVDEYGTTEGVATLTDVLESIAGELPERGEITEPAVIRRDDGTWLVAGSLPFDEFADRFGLRVAPEGGGFHTLAGFVLQQLGHLPESGDSFRYRNFRIEVVDMDGRRVDKVLVQHLPDATEPPDSEAGA
ncbi:MAG: hemolysin family protein [Kiloniellaceae bacterium]